MITKRYCNGETHIYALEPFVRRGDYYAGKSNDGKFITVYYGSELGYPTGGTVLYSIRTEDIDTFIPCTSGSKTT